MFTFTTFALLALSLALLVWVLALLKHTKEQESFMYILLERVEQLEHSVSCYKEMHETELNRADALADEILNNKESSYFLLESYQEELEVAQECIWDKSEQISELGETIQVVADTLLSLSCKEKPVTKEELTELRAKALRWDKLPF